EGRTVGIVLDPLHARRNIELPALEVDQTIGALVATATETNRHAAIIVAATGLRQAFGQRLDGLALVKLRTVDDHQLAQARRNRFEGLECHFSIPSPAQRPVVTSIIWPSSRVMTAFLTSL